MIPHKFPSLFLLLFIVFDQFIGVEVSVSSDRLNALKVKKTKNEAKLSAKMRIKELRCMREKMEAIGKAAPMAVPPARSLAEGESPLALANDADGDLWPKPLMESLRIRKLTDAKKVNKTAKMGAQKTNSVGENERDNQTIVSFSPQPFSSTISPIRRASPIFATTSVPLTISPLIIFPQKQSLALPLVGGSGNATVPPPPPVGDPLQMTWENCRKMESYAKMFGVPDPREWVRNNCFFIQMYVRSPCTDINHFVASCANFEKGAKKGEN